MRKYARRVFPPIALLLLCRPFNGQVNSPNPSNDPYKYFVGQWSGRILVNHDKMPATVKIAVTKEKNGRGMRWDYVFGSAGEKGYKTDTKMIDLNPAKEQLMMHFKGDPEQTYLTLGLSRVIQDGFGQFSASDCNPSKQCRICTFDLRPTSLSYQWKTTLDGKNFDTYSEFVLTRDVDPTQTNPNSPALSN